MLKRRFPAFAALLVAGLVFALGCSSALAATDEVNVVVKNWSQKELQLTRAESSGIFTTKAQQLLRPNQETTARIRDMHGFAPFGFRMTYTDQNDSGTKVHIKYGFPGGSPFAATGVGFLETRTSSDRSGNGSTYEVIIRDHIYGKHPR